jgi:hypothetical protein
MVERPRARRGVVAALACVGLAVPLACGGSVTAGSATLGGTIPGRTFLPVDVAAFRDDADGALEIAIADRAGAACGDLGTDPRGHSQALQIYCYTQDQSPVGPGTYVYPTEGEPLFGILVLQTFDGPADGGYCVDEPEVVPVSATATLTEVSATRVVGSFDMVFAAPSEAGSPDGSAAASPDGAADAGVTHFTGTFTAPWCTRPEGGTCP